MFNLKIRESLRKRHTLSVLVHLGDQNNFDYHVSRTQNIKCFSRMFSSLWTAEDLVSKISFLQICPFLCLYLHTTVKSLILKALSGFFTPSARFTWKDELQWRGTGGMPDWCCHNSINNRLQVSLSSSLLDLKLILGSLVDPLIIGLKVIRQRNRNAF